MPTGELPLTHGPPLSPCRDCVLTRMNDELQRRLSQMLFGGRWLTVEACPQRQPDTRPREQSVCPTRGRAGPVRIALLEALLSVKISATGV